MQLQLNKTKKSFQYVINLSDYTNFIIKAMQDFADSIVAVEQNRPKWNLQTIQQTPAKYLFCSIIIIYSYLCLHILLPIFCLERTE